MHLIGIFGREHQCQRAAGGRTETQGSDCARPGEAGRPQRHEGGREPDPQLVALVDELAVLRAEGWRVTGPHPADTMFHAAARMHYDAALCMYHDQALIPIKALHFDEGVELRRVVGRQRDRAVADQVPEPTLRSSGSGNERVWTLRSRGRRVAARYAVEASSCVIARCAVGQRQWSSAAVRPAIGKLDMENRMVLFYVVLGAVMDVATEEFSTAPLRAGKGSSYEGGIRVPTIVRWPAQVAPGRVSHQAGMTMDLTATILAAAGVPRTADAPLDGIDLLPILAGRAPEVERTLFWRVVNNRPQRAVRQGRWKLVFDGRPLLFDLEADPGERVNLIGRHASVANRLRVLLDEWGREVDADAARRKGAGG